METKVYLYILLHIYIYKKLHSFNGSLVVLLIIFCLSLKFFVVASTFMRVTNDISITIIDLNETIALNMEKVDGFGGLSWRCMLCGQENKDKSRIKRHVETHFPQFSYPCNVCGCVYKNRRSFKTHKCQIGAKF